jgi:Smg protein
MKENVLDVLMYLFENYMEEGPEFNPDQEALTRELTKAGFARREITKAFSWLEDLTTVRAHPARLARHGADGSIRHYAPVELKKLGEECRGFLQFMESNGVLDAVTRELIIDRIMALEVEEISLDELKWVMLMVLFNRPGQESAYHLLEDLVFDEMQGHLH